MPNSQYVASRAPPVTKGYVAIHVDPGESPRISAQFRISRQPRGIVDCRSSWACATFDGCPLVADGVAAMFEGDGRQLVRGLVGLSQKREVASGVGAVRVIRGAPDARRPRTHSRHRHDLGDDIRRVLAPPHPQIGRHRQSDRWASRDASGHPLQGMWIDPVNAHVTT